MSRPQDPAGVGFQESFVSTVPVSFTSSSAPSQDSGEIQAAGDEFYEVPRSMAQVDTYTTTTSSSTAGRTSGATAPRPNPYSSSSGTGGKFSSQSLMYSSGSGTSLGNTNSMSTSMSFSVSEHNNNNTPTSYQREQGLLTSYTTGLKDTDGSQPTQRSSTNPIYRHLQQEQQLQPSIPIDPDGETSENYSTHGESIKPTPDDDPFRDAVGSVDGESFVEDFWASNTTKYDSAALSLPVSASKGEDPEGQVVRAPSTDEADYQSEVPKHAAFPSFRLLTAMIVLIVLGIGGILGGTIWYFVAENSNTLDPILPPSTSPRATPVPTLPPPPSQSPPNTLGPSDQELLSIFGSALGDDAVNDISTSAGMAANWMLNEDPSRFKFRSNDAWIQRYLLVYLYYATTNNRSSAWLSCNAPSTSGLAAEPVRKREGVPDDQGLGETCQFTYPTELPGGRVIYDLVPSYRWLSGADECQWGGVACGSTVIDVFENIATTRSAVTSIVLADQNLQGNLPTELMELPELQVLDLSHNGLGGQLGNKFRTLQTLRLQYNQLDGNIPSDFFDGESKMQELNIGANKMSGPIPGDVGLASQMKEFYIFENRFTGTIPILGNMPLVNFQGQGNMFTGMLPFDLSLGGRWPDTLRTWWAFDNDLSGSLGESLGFLTSLEDLRLQNNTLTGSVPVSIVELQSLFRLDLSSNKFTGTLPLELGELPVLSVVEVQFNAITGLVPTDLCFLESMEVLAADCLSGPPTSNGLVWSSSEPAAVQCYCCTSCCNAATQNCKNYGSYV